MPERQLGAVAAVALLVGLLVGGGAAVALFQDGPGTERDAQPNGTDGPAPADSEAGVVSFESERAFRQYVQRGENGGVGGVATFDRRVAVETAADGAAAGGNGNGAAPAAVETAQMTAAAASGGAAGGSADAQRRTSGTNVQVAGIDEPDVLKTAGDRLYYARQPRFVRQFAGRPTGDDDDWTGTAGSTHVLDTSDPASPVETAQINTSGDLLRSGDRLVVFEDDRLVGYDISNPDQPSQAWTRPVEGSIETARLLNGSLYLVTRSGVSAEDPCPIEPLGADAPVACTDIHRPRGQIDADATYSAFRIDPSDGAVTDDVSFVGTRDRTAIYMSSNALYLTYTERTPRSEIVLDSLLSESIEAPTWVEDRLREIRSYNISTRARSIELQRALRQWYGDDEVTRERVEESIRDYVEQRRRELTTTGIVRVGVGEDMSVESVGEVPGEPLNQFSMSEHEGTLRVATTVPRQYGLDSENDLYTLDAGSLERTGAVTGMGVDQRVYAVRYVGETAYVVTFRRVDPFHVVDLSDPEDPEEVGELKLPGFSSYLHPVDEDHVLGIGREDGEVKAVLFDVSRPSEPTIDDTYYFDAGWSAISESHHAFLLDRRHEVFFVPGDARGYVIDYTDGELTLQKEVAVDGQPQRAAYVGDHMYVFSDRELAVLDERDWAVTDRTDLVEPLSEAPAETVETFFDALKEGDGERAQALLHPDSEEAERFGAILDDDEFREDNISAESATVLYQSGGVAFVEATIAVERDGGTDRFTDRFELRRDGEDWKVWAPR
jgi:uncharacterized secreted protein with C-terminal beta-propeller domain